MSYNIPSVDLAILEELADKYELKDDQNWGVNSDNSLTKRLQRGLFVLGFGPENLACGTHTTVEKPELNYYLDYAFDFRDEDGRRSSRLHGNNHY